MDAETLAVHCRFERFARDEAAGRSPLYAQWAAGIADDPQTARVLARTVRISLRDGMTPISDEPSLTFDSASEQMNERTRSVSLTVRSGQYDRLRDYHLVAVDVQTKVEVLRLPVRIDLAFSNDF